MRAIVADTGPLNYLVLIGQVHLLPLLFEAVFVPEAVRRELEHTDAPPAVRQWIASPPSWLAVQPEPVGWDVGLESLDVGERAAITLALTLHADVILMDDRAGVSIARARGLKVTGTLGFLDLAADHGLVDLAAAFERLRSTSFYCRPELLTALLAKHRTGL